jgi:uncharacterized membrane protein YcaP (DUF421 family)
MSLSWLAINFTRIGEILCRSVIVYTVVYWTLRWAGKRHLSQLSLLDFVLVLLVSNAVQNSMVGTDTSVPGGLAAAIALVSVNVILTRFLLRSDRLSHLFEGEPTLLVRDGHVLEGHLAREGIRRKELEAAIREHGITDISRVRQAILEIDGSISICAYDGHGEHRIAGPPSRRRRMPRRNYRPNG